MNNQDQIILIYKLVTLVIGQQRMQQVINNMQIQRRLEFDLNDYSDKLEHKRAIAATDAFIALHDIDNMLREYTKYSKGIDIGDTINLPDGPYKLNSYESQLLHQLAEIIRMKVSCILDDNGINMDYLE